MQYGKYKAEHYAIQQVQSHWFWTSRTMYSKISSKGKKNLKYGDVDTVEAALMIFLNVKVREHKEALLDIIRFIVHIKSG